ncbi:hypothetical protein [Streptosporangium saharense]|uniref:Uncharacterized protein n=1 Tax=Streptosporangium saharense TaxID=1706840 RepID=A0A7W7VM41_9ACTN|nr:hypothetical protein [Streptosporangium saharense]MBB4915074.1 hypothetical protein [Streptosporangium saharense]
MTDDLTVEQQTALDELRQLRAELQAVKDRQREAAIHARRELNLPQAAVAEALFGRADEASRRRLYRLVSSKSAK